MQGSFIICVCLNELFAKEEVHNADATKVCTSTFSTGLNVEVRAKDVQRKVQVDVGRDISKVCAAYICACN